MKLITIFTPTYNRGNKLYRLYDVLSKQDNKDFEWLVIDDGSTDNTVKVIEQFISEKKIKIRYFKKSNGGKQSCWNYALQKANGKYFVGIDSDDTIIEDGIEKIIKYLPKIENKEDVIGLRMGNIAMSTQKRSGGFLKEGYYSWRDEVFIWKNLGEKIDVYKIEKIRKKLYPVNKQIKFIPEIWLYSKISKEKLKFYYTLESLGKYWDVNFENDGDRLTFASHRKHLKGHIIARAEVINNDLDLFFKYPIYHIKNALRYIECCILEKDDVYIRLEKFKSKLFISVLYAAGFALSKIKIKKRSEM